MLNTKPSYINADKLPLRHMWRASIKDKQFYFSSKWKLIYKTAYMWLPLLTGGSFFVFIAGMYHEFTDDDKMGILMVFAMSIIPIIMMLPFILLGAYYSSVIKVNRNMKQIFNFIKTNLPDAFAINFLTPVNCTFIWEDKIFEIAKTQATGRCGNKEKPVTLFVIALYYTPGESAIEKYFDENGYMRESLKDEWYGYCQGKRSCWNLNLETNLVYVSYQTKDNLPPGLVEQALSQMDYLLKRFDLYPLSITDD